MLRSRMLSLCKTSAPMRLSTKNIRKRSYARRGGKKVRQKSDYDQLKEVVLSQVLGVTLLAIELTEISFFICAGLFVAVIVGAVVMNIYDFYQYEERD